MSNLRNKWRSFPVDGKKLNFLMAFGRGCKGCGGAIGALFSVGKTNPTIDLAECESNHEAMFNGGICPYCSSKGNADLKLYTNPAKTYETLKQTKFSADTVSYYIECKNHGPLVVLIKGRKDIGFSDIRRKLGLKSEFIPRYDLSSCPICGRESKVLLAEITSMNKTPLGVLHLFDDKQLIADELAKTGYRKINSPLLHVEDEALRGIASDLLLESSNMTGDRTPQITTIRKWLKNNIREGMITGLSRGKLVRSDLEALADKEANWIEYCILFYALARNLGVECKFGAYETTKGHEDYSEVLYLIFAKENKTTVAIPPWAMFCNTMAGPDFKPDRPVDPKELDEPDELLDIREFLRRVHLLSKLRPFSAMHTTPLLYYADRCAIWLRRPQSNILSIVVTEGNRQLLEFRYIFEKEQAGTISVHSTFIDLEKKTITTSSGKEAKKYSGKNPEGFHVLITRGTEPVIVAATKRIISTKNMGNPFLAVFFSKNLEKMLRDFAVEVKKHYDPSYA